MSTVTDNLVTRVSVLEERVSHQGTLLGQESTRTGKLEERMTAAEKQAVHLETVVKTTGRNVVVGVTIALTVIGLLFKFFSGA